MRTSGCIRSVALALALVLSVAAGPAAAQAVRIGYLGFLGEAAEGSPLRGAFLAGLDDAGFVPGKSIVVETRRWTDTRELSQAIDELLRLKVEALVVGPPIAATTAQRATRKVPIVCISCGDPVDIGLARSLARPGGNVTGLASLSAELVGKRFGLLRELLPATNRVAVFVFPANPGMRPTLAALGSISKTLQLQVQHFEIRSADDFVPALLDAAKAKVDAVVFQDDPLVRFRMVQIAEVAASHRLPIVTGLPDVAAAGTLVAYGPDRVDMSRRSATWVAKILRGANAGTLPFEQAAKLELVINLKSAKALGIAVPQALLFRADRVIE